MSGISQGLQEPCDPAGMQGLRDPCAQRACMGCETPALLFEIQFLVTFAWMSARIHMQDFPTVLLVRTLGWRGLAAILVISGTFQGLQEPCASAGYVGVARFLRPFSFQGLRDPCAQRACMGCETPAITSARIRMQEFPRDLLVTTPGWQGLATILVISGIFQGLQEPCTPAACAGATAAPKELAGVAKPPHTHPK